MMSLLLRQCTYVVHKIQGLLEIREVKFTVQMMFVDNAPLGNAPVKFFKLFALQGSNSSAARHTRFIGKLFSHSYPTD